MGRLTGAGSHHRRLGRRRPWPVWLNRSGSSSATRGTGSWTKALSSRRSTQRSHHGLANSASGRLGPAGWCCGRAGHSGVHSVHSGVPVLSLSRFGARSLTEPFLNQLSDRIGSSYLKVAIVPTQYTLARPAHSRSLASYQRRSASPTSPHMILISTLPRSRT